MTIKLYYDKFSVMKKILIILFLMSFVFVSNGYSFWIWTPKSGKWVNPKYSVKQNPKEHFDYAMGFYNKKSLKRAIAEFRRLIKNYSDAYEAAEAQFYIGKSFEGLRKDYEAYKAYQLVIDKYPFNKRHEEIIRIEYDIAERFISNRDKSKFLGLNFQLEDPAVEIFKKIEENSPYSKLAAKSIYRLGVYLKAKELFIEGQKEFENLLDKYPNSEWVEPARFQLAECLALISPEAEYSQNITQEAREKFEDFAQEHPEAILGESARIKVRELKEKEAESNFIIAQFYEKQKDFESAKIYYNYVIDNYPESDFVVKALEGIKEIDKK